MTLPKPPTPAELDVLRQKAQPTVTTTQVQQEITADSTDAQLSERARRFGYLVGIAHIDWLALQVFTQQREIQRLQKRLESLEVKKV